MFFVKFNKKYRAVPYTLFIRNFGTSEPYHSHMNFIKPSYTSGKLSCLDLSHEKVTVATGTVSIFDNIRPRRLNASSEGRSSRDNAGAGKPDTTLSAK